MYNGASCDSYAWTLANQKRRIKNTIIFHHVLSLTTLVFKFLLHSFFISINFITLQDPAIILMSELVVVEDTCVFLNTPVEKRAPLTALK